jgi:2-iminobutanoate/2-iminopropanoate deaminase
MISQILRNAVKLTCIGFAIAAFVSLPAVRTPAQQNAPRQYIQATGSLGGLPFSEAVLTGKTLYIAGHIGTDSTGQAPKDVDQEIKLLFDAFRTTVGQAHLKMDDLVYVHVFCTDLSLYDKFNAQYRAQFSKDFPARAFVGVASLLRGAHFEMQGIAVAR